MGISPVLSFEVCFFVSVFVAVCLGASAVSPSLDIVVLVAGVMWGAGAQFPSLPKHGTPGMSLVWVLSALLL